MVVVRVKFLKPTQRHELAEKMTIHPYLKTLRWGNINIAIVYYDFADKSFT
jgi:hypothetical protein